MPDKEDRDFVKAIDHGKQDQLRDDIGGRDQCGQQEDADHGIFADVAQTLGTDQTGLAHQREQHRKLEAKPECDDELERDVERLVHLAEESDLEALGRGRNLDGIGWRIASRNRQKIGKDRTDIGKSEKESHRQRRDDELRKRRPEQEHHRRGDQEWQECGFFGPVEPGRHETPHLRANHRKGQREAEHHRDAKQREKIFLRRGILQRRVGVAHRPKRFLDREKQELQDRFCHDEGQNDAHDERQNRADEPRAQLRQMLDQRGGTVLDLVLGV